jgi:mRNA interferase RelE/StbE
VLYNIYIDTQAQKALAAMPKKVQRQIGRKIDALAKNPFPNNAKLIQRTTDIYRIRSGDYRIAYKVRHKRLLILVISIGHRKDFYQKLL